MLLIMRGALSPAQRAGQQHEMMGASEPGPWCEPALPALASLAASKAPGKEESRPITRRAANEAEQYQATMRGCGVRREMGGD
jgi:hypothetical protein